jgi:hypothetical protein
MAECEARAVLMVTITPAGTATHLMRSRVELRCRLESGHAGAHRDTEHGESWESTTSRPTTLLRHEDEDGDG